MSKKKAKAVESTELTKSTKMEEAMENQNIVEEPILPAVEEESKTPKTEKKRAPRVYKLEIGRLPESSQKPLGLHAIVITEAISDLVNEGKTSATREEIMQKACELGLYDRKPSKQGTTPIFSWWRKPLSSLGWLSQGEENEVKVSTEEDLPVEENPEM